MSTPAQTRATVKSVVRSTVRRIPGAIRLRRALAHAEHRLRLRFGKRQNQLFTKFCRVPTQLEVLARDGVDFLGGGARDEPLRVVVFGCSIGAEPYSIASVLRARHPGVPVEIECFDIEPSVIERARTASYQSSDVVKSAALPADFIDTTFDRDGEQLTVKPELRAAARFDLGDVLDTTLIRRLAPADIVVAQNFLFHLEPAAAERAFGNLRLLLKERAVLMIDGTDLDLRARLTAAAGLRPCATELERIHDESRVERGWAWPSIYWGLEPMNARRDDAARRYSTIFFAEN